MRLRILKNGQFNHIDFNLTQQKYDVQIRCLDMADSAIFITVLFDTAITMIKLGLGFAFYSNEKDSQ